MDAQGYTSDKGYINFLKRLGKLTTKGEEIYTKMSEGKSLIKDEKFEPVSEELMRKSDGEGSLKAKLKAMNKQIKQLLKKNEND